MAEVSKEKGKWQVNGIDDEEEEVKYFKSKRDAIFYAENSFGFYISEMKENN